MTDFYVYLSFFVIKQVKKHRNIHIKFFTFLQGGGVSTFCSIIHFIFFHFIGGEGGCKGRKCHFHFLLCLFFLIASLTSTPRSSKKTQFDITFDQTVTITESFYPSLSFTKLFADLGGSLGLWLGVGIIQLISYLLQFISYLKNCGLNNTQYINMDA